MGKTTAFSTADEQEYAEVRGNTVPDMLYDVAARAATTSVGLFVYKRIDNLLWTIEKTARWSLPQPSPASVSSKTPAADESEDIGSNISRPPLIRPLPWLLFLPALIALRMVRSALSMGARVVGRGPVLPSSVVGFLQNKRRKLRALKYRGQRLQRIAQIEQNADPKQVSWLQRIIVPFRMVICTRPYRSIDANSDVAHAVVFRKDRPSSTDQKRVVSKKRNLNQREAESAEEEASDEDSFEDAGCKVLLDKYADEEDSSFNMADASSASSGGTDSSLSDADPSPKKLQSGKQSQQEQQSLPKQNGGQQPPSKSDTLTRSLSENKNGVDSQPTATKTSAQKAINAGNRSKSAADLENGNAQSSNTSETESKSAASTNIAGSTTPSKSIPNLSNSPENNENKPINQNVAGGPTASVAAASQIKSTSPTVLKSTTAKQSPIMSDVRSNFQQQKQASQKQLGSAGQQQQQQQQQQLLQASQQQQQHVGNGAKSRNKKGATQSSFA
ncbi:SUN domain-containing protein 2 isoform X2 [Anopheles stephensi]|uniref:SUN domain-containing protein 2 isoform X2 n=1 Tax=Anopheles stephensi TaxID=30069 RepID=UPI001658BFEB|nr:SUN domain-containing protein 2 isoform X2 [Anopheles stephensi]